LYSLDDELDNDMTSNENNVNESVLIDETREEMAGTQKREYLADLLY
ncbi:2487_t:CDS:1, partial [Gigaspora rosea]